MLLATSSSSILRLELDIACAVSKAVYKKVPVLSNFWCELARNRTYALQCRLHSPVVDM